MIAHFIEATNGPRNYGKFVLLRHDEDPGSKLPGYEGEPLLSSSRKFGWPHTFVLDLQTGEGAAFIIGGKDPALAAVDLAKHRVWVCPLYEPFLTWLYAQDLPPRDPRAILTLPRHVDLPEAGFAFAGYRRRGHPLELGGDDSIRID